MLCLCIVHSCVSHPNTSGWALSCLKDQLGFMVGSQLVEHQKVENLAFSS